MIKENNLPIVTCQAKSENTNMLQKLKIQPRPLRRNVCGKSNKKNHKTKQ